MVRLHRAVLKAPGAAATTTPRAWRRSRVLRPGTGFGGRAARACGAHRSVRDLNADIRAWIETWNDDPKPYVWTKTADQILESIATYCTRINESRH